MTAWVLVILERMVPTTYVSNGMQPTYFTQELRMAMKFRTEEAARKWMTDKLGTWPHKPEVREVELPLD